MGGRDNGSGQPLAGGGQHGNSACVAKFMAEAIVTAGMASWRFAGIADFYV